MRNMASPDTGLIANLRSDGRHMMEQLRGATGAGFDRAYMENMVSGHQNALNAVKQLSQSAQQQDVKKYLTDLVPKVQDHLERAQKVQKGLTGAS
jgi:putative membrane protein